MKKDLLIRLFLCVVASALLGSTLACVQGATLRFGFLPRTGYLLLAAGYTAISFIFFVVAAFYRKDRKRPALLVSASLVLLFALFALNRNPLPNVLLVVSDATRADHLSVYGYDRNTTPFLQHLAQEAIVFDQAMAQGTHTIVSTPSIVASVYPSTHKVTSYQKVLGNDFVLLSELLKDAGYATFGCAANPHVGPLNGFSQGFDTYITPSFWEDVNAPTVFLSLLRWLPESSGKPFFGFLFCIDPHTPYNPPPHYDTLFDPTWEGDVIKGGHHGGQLPPRALYNMIAQYDGEIALVDNALEQLFDELRKRNLYRNTLIIYTSDHGEDLYDREDDFGHGKAPYEEVVHVPLIIRFPSPVKLPIFIPAGRSEEVVSHVDILPTIAEFLHLPRPQSAMGESFLNLGSNSLPANERYAFIEEILHQYGPYHIQAIRTKRYKLIDFIQYEEDRNRPTELFDLAIDPEEETNILSACPEIAPALREKMEHMKALASSGPTHEVKEVELDETTLDGLRALGYLE